ncbi:MAG: AAA family ATPase [Candidatus Rokubacteria bacterium]|nr:AAA family ATPase [Candidatus Rokubacteria bacterium]
MRCARCEADNRAGRRFCARCGAPLALACVSCGFENDPGDEFCGGCGQPPTPGGASAPVTRSAEVQAPSAPAPPADEGERRQLSVMFCDLVGSTALSSRLDPEEFRAAVRGYQAASAVVIARFEGHVAQYLGDGLLVYFGYPAAHEDDAQRAVLAGLGIIQAIGALPARLESERGVSLAVRVGIHTGPVVVGESGGGARRERLALGETPNIAARLQAFAEPGTVVISGATHRLVRRAFECHDLGPQRIPGLDAPIPAYRVLGESLARSPAVDTAGPSSVLVGRDRQVALLVERWQDAAEDVGQVVLLTGEPGVGKSRLVQALKERVAGSSHVVLEGRCSPYYQNSPMHLVTQLLCGAVGFGPDDMPDEKLDRLENVLVELGIPSAEAVPLFTSLLALPANRYPALAWTPQRQREKTIEAVLAILWSVAGRDPMLLVVEDLQWADPSSLELLTRLVEQAAPYRVFALFTGRPEFRPPWPPRSHVSQVMLNRLPRRNVEEMVTNLTAGKPLPAGVLQQIVARTDGVPLFVEELTKTVLESGLVEEREGRYELVGPLPPLGIPSTLQDSLAARLDRLGEAKAVAQLGATIGREFSYELLAAVSPLEPERLRMALDRLVEAELLYRRGAATSATYVFKHGLIQEAAYQSLLRSVRQHYHRRIVQVLGERFPAMLDAHPELAAHHCTEAGLAAQAVPYWQRAGERAIRRSASAEAIAHLEKGIELVGTLPDTSARREQELELQISLGPVLSGSRGFAAPETVRAYERARQLCSQLGGTPRVIPALWGLWGYFATQGSFRQALEVGEELLERARQTGDPGLLLQAHHALWPVSCSMGDPAASRAHIEAGQALYDPERHPALAFVYGGHDARVCAHTWDALNLWKLGYPTRALKASQAGLRWTTQLSQPHSTAVTLVYGSLLKHLRREEQAAREVADACIALAREQGFPQWLSMAQIYGGSALAALGRMEEGLAEIREGLAAYRATGAGAERPTFLTLLAEVHWRRGAWQDGLVAVSEGLDIIAENGECAFEAELHRIRGELLLGRSPADQGEVEASFQRARGIARSQSARSWELRAATSLARLWQRQGKREDARGLLGEVYAWFTEGFDTADLKETKALLDELSSA